MTPDTAITSGEKLHVRVHEQIANAKRPVYECTAAYVPPSVNQCTLLRYAYTDSTGFFRVVVRAIVGPVGTLGGACDADHSCLIVSFITYTTKKPISAPISFAP